jgi:hypothetical protein
MPCVPTKLLKPFCPFTATKVFALKATALLLLTLLIKAKVRITACSALAGGSALALVAIAASLHMVQQRRSAAT